MDRTRMGFGARSWPLLIVGAWLLLAGGALQVLAQPADPARRGHGGPIRSIAVLPDGRTLVTGGFDSAIIVWDIASGAAKRVLRFHQSAVTALLALGRDCFASGGEDARIAVWCGTAASPFRVLEGHQASIAALAGGGVAGLMASASWDGQVRVWLFDPAKPAAAAEAPLSLVAVEHKAPVNGQAWVRAGRHLVTASYDGEVRLTEIGAAAPPRTLRLIKLPAALNGMAVTVDGRIVLTGADGHIRILGTDLEPLTEIELADGPLTAVAISPDGRIAAVAGMRTPVTLIDLATGQVLRRILGPGLPIWALAFSTDGRELFTGGADRALRRWTVATGAPVGDTLSPAADMLPVAANEPGAQVFRACRACHTINATEGHRAGPTLHGVMGRRIASAADYGYSDALKGMDIVWSKETIARLFEIGPNAMTPGTKMPEQRLTDPAEREALVEWLARVTKH